MYKRLYELREYNDLYQKDIAKVIGISQQTYSQWENGTKIIPLKHLNTLCNYYKVSMDYVLGLSDIKYYESDLKNLNKKTIGNNIRNLRNKYKLTMRDLAKELNTTSSTISGYENAKTLIITAFAYQLCKKYKISLDDLVGRKKGD
ncbi:MAG: helix-turn-helix transcriptional regulator [Clostridia bacterium]|nr:helix-turn-helix transcriptional regulator [Clostridia bacterium]